MDRPRIIFGILTLFGFAVSIFSNVPITYAATVSCSFSRNLVVGSVGADVRNLQIILNENPATQVATSGNGSPGNETSYYGPATKSAVARYQQLHTQAILLPYGLSQGTGVFATLTRQYFVTTSCANAPVVFNYNSPTMTPTPTPTIPTPTQTQTTQTTQQTQQTVQQNPAPAIIPASPSVLAPLLAQLNTTDSADDSAILQSMVDLAYADHLSNITLPAGTFRLDHTFHLYGSNLTFSGQGDQTLFDINNHYDGQGNSGWGITIGVVFDPSHTSEANFYPLTVPIFNPSQPVSGNTIVFSQPVPFTPGEQLFLNNGKGATNVVEKALGGTLPMTGEFFERAPSEFVTVASVSSDGKTVTLQNNVIGHVNEYSNVLPTGQASSENYLVVFQVVKPADHITLQNIAFKFTDYQAQADMYSIYASNIVLNHIDQLGPPPEGSGINIAGTTNVQITNSNLGVGDIGLNSDREATISNNTVSEVSLEEAVTDSTIEHNTLGYGGTALGIRIGDMPCTRDSIIYNTISAANSPNGAVAIAEGSYDTVAYNTANNSFWIGTGLGVTIHDNTATSFADFGTPSNDPSVYNNSWQQTSFNFNPKLMLGAVYEAFQSVVRAFKLW